MLLKHLHLVHFKNHSGADVSLGPQVNCFLGDNGSGKTTCFVLGTLSRCDPAPPSE